ncbi:MAG: single-stranded DNA-binding protein [Spirochaetota bacterium]|nr:single-stranded DNA-binding protein [Spirochaetota bacterium]
MPRDLNRVMLIGRLGRDPELRYTQTGSPVANFSIANNRSYTTSSGEKREEVNFFNCIAWSKLGEIIVEYCKKGRRIGIEGRLQQRSWDDKDGNKRSTVEIVVENFQFLDSKSTVDDNVIDDFVENSTQPSNNVSSHAFNENPFSDEDVPF